MRPGNLAVRSCSSRPTFSCSPASTIGTRMRSSNSKARSPSSAWRSASVIFLRGTEVFGIGIEHPRRQSRGLLPIGVFQIHVQQQLGLLAALVQVGDLLQGLGGLCYVAFGRMNARLDDYGGHVLGVEL